jgi:hypothetical protein
MEPNRELREIPYHEYLVIAQLLRAHLGEYGERLRAMIAFGNLLTTGNSAVIELLEVVEEWRDKRLWQFSSTEELPLRGQLRLYFLTPEEFEDPSVIQDAEERKWVEELLQRVRRGYEVIMGKDREWVSEVLDGSPTISSPPSGMGHSPSALALTPSG